MTLDEIAAAAELILAQDVASESKEVASGSESSDEGFGGEVDSDLEDEHMEELKRGGCHDEELGDSGYGANSISPVAMETRYVKKNQPRASSVEQISWCDVMINGYRVS